MRLVPLLALASLLAGCSASSVPPTTPTVSIAPQPAASPEPKAPAATPKPRHPRHPRWKVAEQISELLRAASADRRTFELEPSGRVVVKDVKEPLEEEFYLGDVGRVVYDYEAGRAQPHWVKVYINQSGAERARWRQKNGPWQLITSPFVVLPLKDRDAAEEVVAKMVSLIAP